MAEKRNYEGVGLKRMSTAEMEVLKGVLERIVYENEEIHYRTLFSSRCEAGENTVL
jgi:hypothetical protein